MKDLRFKIIADFVKGGFDAAGNAVGSLKAKFAGFFDVSKIGWGSVAGVAAAAIGGIAQAADMLRSKWLGMMSELEQSTVDFDQNNARIFRKIRFMNTETDKARLQEDLQNQIRGVTIQVDEAKRQDDTAISPWQKWKKNITDFAQKEVNVRLGFGNFTDDELKIKRLEEKLFSLKKSLDIVNKAKVETFFESSSKKISDIEDADALREGLENNTEEVVKVLEKKVAESKDAMEKAMGILSKQGATEIERDAADKAIETWKLYKEKLVEAKKALEGLNEESANHPPEAPTMEKSEKPKSKKYKMPQSELDRNRDGKDSKFRDEEDNLDPYAMDLDPSMTKSNGGMTRRLRGEGGLSGRRGRRITSFSTPAHLADAIKSRSAGLGEGDLNRDPLLIAMKEAQKTREKGNDLLERIEKKTGAAP